MAELSKDDTVPQFVKPTREILVITDLQKWQRSQAYRDFYGFISTLNTAVKGKKLSSEYHVSEVVTQLVALLDTLDSWIEQIPPIEQPQRYGNKAYRDWSLRLAERSAELIEPLLPEKFKSANIELSAYLCGGFGNATRIDYGTGHEASFTAFLCCLYKLRILTPEDEKAIVFKVFNRYLELTRKIQKSYNMEPAGSQGVWGLDDFQFLPFMWGSSQLIGHPDITPSSFVIPETVDMYREDYMFFECVKFIMQMKTGPFAEHSNTLWGISGVAEWSKVNSGLIKMYKAEVLGKFPVIQHFEFGTLLSIESGWIPKLLE